MNAEWAPDYIELFETKELAKRADALASMLSPCMLCPRSCHALRKNGGTGACHSGMLPIVSSYCIHFGEEPPLVGGHGTGNIFLGNCNLRCVYCQNYVISQNPRAERHNEVPVKRLAEIMLQLQQRKCATIGFVSPTHFTPQIVEALLHAVPRGFNLPIVYNSGGYDSVEVLKLLEGIVQVYLPDLKYSSDEAALRYSGVANYTSHARAAIKEMHRQVGSTLITGKDNEIKRGLIIRMLVLPNGIAGVEENLKFIADELGTNVTLSIMSQYYPTNRAHEYPELARPLLESEYNRVLEMLDELGFRNGWVQEFGSKDVYRPDFSDREQPFKGQATSRQGAQPG